MYKPRRNDRRRNTVREARSENWGNHIVAALGTQTPGAYTSRKRNFLNGFS